MPEGRRGGATIDAGAGLDPVLCLRQILAEVPDASGAGKELVDLELTRQPRGVGASPRSRGTSGPPAVACMWAGAVICRADEDGSSELPRATLIKYLTLFERVRGWGAAVLFAISVAAARRGACGLLQGGGR
jgi:hypothetical protein